MNRDWLLEVEDVDAYYGAIQALRGVSLHVENGEIVTLIGANGAGKSTLLMTIYGTPRAQSGRISVFGRDITRTPTEQIASLGVALVPEGRRVFPAMTIAENLLLGTSCLGAGQFERDLSRMYDMFPVLGKRYSQRAGTLSGGEQQMLAIARALMSRPKLLLLDEPRPRSGATYRPTDISHLGVKYPTKEPQSFWLSKMRTMR